MVSRKGLGTAGRRGTRCRALNRCWFRLFLSWMRLMRIFSSLAGVGAFSSRCPCERLTL